MKFERRESDVEKAKKLPCEEIYRQLFASFALNKPFPSPLRDEASPSFNLFRGRSGKILWHDFGTGETGDAIELVARIHNESFLDACKRVLSKNLKTITFTQSAEFLGTEKRPINYKVVGRLFSAHDLAYWDQYHVPDSVLKRYGVMRAYTIHDGDRLIYRSKDTNPCYAWRAENGLWKFYLPFSNHNKHFGNANKQTVFGEQHVDLSKTVLLVKGMKACVTFAANMEEFSPIAAQSEAMLVNEDLVRRYENNLLSCYDNDASGHLWAAKNQDAGIRVALPPNGFKDFEEAFRFDKEKTKFHLRKIANTQKFYEF